jgi:hypothetical protein
LLTLFSAANIVILIIGILSNACVNYGVTVLSKFDLIAIGVFSTGYLVFAVPIYFLFALIFAVGRSIVNKRRALKMKPAQ